MTTSENRKRMPAGVILLDLIGTLLFMLGFIDRMDLRLLGPVSELTAGHGWPLMIGGGIAMFLGTGLFVIKLVMAQRAQHTPAVSPAIQTVDRRAR